MSQHDVSQHRGPERPVRIKRIKDSAGRGTAIEIVWSDNRITILESTDLRESCPCATCQEMRGASSHSTPLGGVARGREILRVVHSLSGQDLDLKQVWSVGNYAIGLGWGDGHNSGIYTFEKLSSMARELP